MTDRDWRQSLLPRSARIKDAIQSLDSSAMQIALVVDEHGRLVGTVTDGDIRRGLLRGLDLTSAIDTIVHDSPLVVPPQLKTDAVLQIMKANKVSQLPVVDDQRHVTGLHVWSQLQTAETRPNLVVIMAGGKGVRLRPHTENCPKPLLAVAGKPMLEHIIEHAKRDGFRRFVIAIHYLGEMIEDYFGDGHALGVSIDYLREEHPLGTGGALSLLPSTPDLPIVVSNGDVLTDVRYAEILDFHERHGATATMAVRSHEWQHPFGVVKVQGVDIAGFEEKPVYRSHVNAGIYALSPDALAMLHPGERCDMPSLFERVQAADGRTIVYPMHEPWLDVGRPDDLDQARTTYAIG